MSRRGAVGVLAGTAALVTWALPAAAHVTVSPTEATRGATADLVLTVPNESRTSATTRLDVELPAGLTTVTPSSPPGWSATVTGQVVTWTGGRVEVGGRADFRLRIGPLPTGDRFLLPAVQTYDDGTVVRWIQQPTGDGHSHGSGAERPAPVVTLVGTPPTTTTTAPSPSTVTDDDAPAPGTTASAADGGSGDDSSAASWLVGAGALVAVGGVTGLVLVGRRSRPRS